MEEQKVPAQVEPQLYNPSDSSENFDGDDFSQNSISELQDIEPVEWSASEYIAHEKSSMWYVGLFGIGGLIVVLMYVITRDVLASVVVLIASASMSVYAGRKPETKRYRLDDSGVQVADKTYPYSLFKSFSVVDEGAIDSVWLKPLKRFSPLVVMYFSPEDEEKIVNVLSSFLPHEQRELDMMDHISKKMRF